MNNFNDIDIDFDEVEENITKDDEEQTALVVKDEYSLEYIRSISNKRKGKWAIVLASVLLILLGFSFLMLWVIKTQVLKPLAISNITKYVAPVNTDEVILTDDTITYSPLHINESLKLVDFKDLLYAKSDKIKEFNFSVFYLDDKKNKKFIKELSEDNIIKNDKQYFLKIVIPSKNNSLFSLEQETYKELPIKIDLSKFIFIYGENNQLIYKGSRAEILRACNEYQIKENITFKQAFYKTLNSELKDVYTEDEKVTAKYQKIFNERERLIQTTDFEKLLSDKKEQNILYTDNISTADFDTIFRFYNSSNDKYYELKTMLGQKFDYNLLTKIRAKIKLPEKEYYLKNTTGHDYLDIKGEKVLLSAETDTFEISQFITEKDNLLSYYDFSKEQTYLPDNYFKETVEGKAYNVINIYPIIERKKAYMVFKTENDEIIEKLQFSCGNITQMPIDLSYGYNKNEKYFHKENEYFAGWKVLNDNGEITYKKIKEGNLYKFTTDIICEPIIQKRIAITLNLPHYEYKPNNASETNYQFLTSILDEDANVYQEFVKVKKEKLTILKEFASGNEFLGMYTDELYLNELPQDMLAKDYPKDGKVYFKYKYTYIPIIVAGYTELIQEGLKDAYLYIPYNKDENLEQHELLSILFNLNKGNKFEEALNNLSYDFSYYEYDDYHYFRLQINSSDNYEVYFYCYDIYTLEQIETISLNVSTTDKLKKVMNQKLNTKIAYPYYAANNSIYRILQMSYDRDFLSDISPDITTNKIKKITKHFVAIFLKVEKTEVEVNYFANYSDFSYSQKIRVSTHPGNYILAGVYEEFMKFGYQPIQTNQMGYVDDEGVIQRNVSCNSVSNTAETDTVFCVFKRLETDGSVTSWSKSLAFLKGRKIVYGTKLDFYGYYGYGDLGMLFENEIGSTYKTHSLYCFYTNENGEIIKEQVKRDTVIVANMAFIYYYQK